MPALSGPGPSRRPSQACPSRPEARDVKRAAASSSAGARRCSAPWDMIRPASWCVTTASDGHNREASCRASGHRACTIQRRAGTHHSAATHGQGLSLEGARLLQRERVQRERAQGERVQREAACSSLTPSGASAKAPSATYANASCGCKVRARRAAASAASSDAPAFSSCTACITSRWTGSSASPGSAEGAAQLNDS